MEKKCAFTICTRSYQGLAETLRDSFLEFNPGFDFFIIYADLEDVSNFASAKTIMMQYISEEKYEEMAFKYDLTEFCTSIKPFVFLYLLEKSYELAVYFDPDLVFFSKFEELNDCSKIAYITPHILTPQGKEYMGKQTDNLILRCGIYNCGFIAFRNSVKSLEIINWWKDKLQDLAYNDPWLGLFTDQRWIDFLPAFISQEELCIIKNAGCNLAPWNYYERKIEKKENLFYVISRNNKFNTNYKLVFIHASGYNYKQLCNGKIFHNSRDLLETNDIDELLHIYGEKLKMHNTESYFSIPYKYNYFSDGNPIIKIHRRIIRRACEENVLFNNLFDSNGNYYKYLKQNKMILKNAVNNITPKNTENYSKKFLLLTQFLKMCKNILGIKKFIQFLAGMHKYTREEEVALYIGKKSILSEK